MVDTATTIPTIGSGPNAIRLMLSEDAYTGDAQFTVAVDGTQISGVQTATASHAAGATQMLDILGSFAPGAHTVTVNFLNDAFDGPNADRNLYVDGLSSGGVASTGGSLYSGGPASFQVQVQVLATGTGNHVVTDAAGLDAAIMAADAATSGNIVITFGADITEQVNLSAVNLKPGITLTIDGQGHQLSGSGTFRGLFAYAGTLTVRDLTFANTAAFGGNGGSEGAGGGAGLGGGLFVAGTNAGIGSGAAVTLQNVNFRSSGAIGGNGNGGGGMFEGQLGPYGTAGGGGGMGGAGGSYGLNGGGGGGIGSGSATATSAATSAAGGSSTAGQPGIVVGAPGGSSGAAANNMSQSPSLPGGADGGGGGGTTFGSFRTGGGGGVGASGIDGGFGGGGGGGVGTTKGGNGGFGGGGGSTGGNGGFGGGGASRGLGGFGGGNGSTSAAGNGFYSFYDGGGGLAAGGAVFIQQGGSLTISGGFTQDGYTQAGRGGLGSGEGPNSSAQNGQGVGTDIFLQGNQTLTFVEAANQTTTISGSIADQTGSRGTGANAGAGSLSLGGTGRLVLSAGNSYSGGTSISGGTLELATLGAAGSGAIAFTGTTGVLQIDADAVPSDGSFDNAITGFGPGRLIDVKGFDYVGAAANIVGNTLTVTSGGRQLRFDLAGADQAPPLRPVLSLDRAGGVLVGAQIAPQIDTITFNVSEDAWQGDAQYTVSVDGAQIGGVRTATASHAAGASQAVTLSGQFSDFGTGLHRIGINFLNDAYGGSNATDRNLYVDSLAFDGRAAQPAGASFFSSGSMEFVVPQLPAPAALTLLLSEDAFQGDAQYSIAVDGQAVGSGSVTAAHAAGTSQAVNLSAALGAGMHDLALSFLNDAYGGSSDTDRNLYLIGLQVNGAAVPDATASLFSTGTQHFQFNVAHI